MKEKKERSEEVPRKNEVKFKKKKMIANEKMDLGRG